MINPWKVHRARGVVVSLRESLYSVAVKLDNGQVLDGWVDAKSYNKLAVGQRVNIQAQFCISLDRYSLKTVRPAK